MQSMPDHTVCYTRGMQRDVEVDWLWARMRELKPQTILEIGVGSGACTGLLALAGARVIGVDLVIHPPFEYFWHQDERYIREQANPQIGMVLGDSQATRTHDQVVAICPEYDWVVIDADHSLAGGRRDWELYAPLARQAILIHDIAQYQTAQGDWFPRVDWPAFKAQYRTAECVEVPAGGWGLIYLDGQRIK